MRAIWWAAAIPGARSGNFRIADCEKARLWSGFVCFAAFAAGLSSFTLNLSMTSATDRLFECIHFLHRCRETVLCDNGGRWETMRTIDIVRSAPRVLFSILLDLKTHDFLVVLSPISGSRGLHRLLLRMDGGELEIAYLIPSPANMGPAEERSVTFAVSYTALKPMGELAGCSAALGWHRMLSRTRLSIPVAALTSSGKPRCFPTT